ncbi:MAG: chloride channel protein, partial [Pseudomonadota bacterium]|nr:chloride channel protein [Pseudomonadota bacterium]
MSAPDPCVPATPSEHLASAVPTGAAGPLPAGSRSREGPFRLFGPARRTVTLWLWSALVGALAAAATVAFRWLTTQVERLSTGHVGG